MIHSSLFDSEPHYFEFDQKPLSSGDHFYASLHGLEQPHEPDAFVRYDDPGFTCKAGKVEFEFIPLAEPVDWKVEGRDYYSITKGKILFKEDGGVVMGEGWFDHDRLPKVWDILWGGNWDWISIKLYNGTNLMIGKNKRQSFAIIEHNGKIYKDFLVPSGNGTIALKNMSYSLVLKPIGEEKVFRPKYGMKYSEQPQLVFLNGREVGYGMRERTYMGKAVEESKLIYSNISRSI
jgi:hypothetical protein